MTRSVRIMRRGSLVCMHAWRRFRNRLLVRALAKLEQSYHAYLCRAVPNRDRAAARRRRLRVLARVLRQARRWKANLGAVLVGEDGRETTHRPPLLPGPMEAANRLDWRNVAVVDRLGELSLLSAARTLRAYIRRAALRCPVHRRAVETLPGFADASAAIERAEALLALERRH